MAISPEKFRHHREKANFSLAEAAIELGVCERTIQRYETGESKIPPASLMVLKTHGKLSAVKHVENRSFSFIDLFAGIGGLRRGFAGIGGHCVFTSEWDRFAQQTYHANYPQDNRPAEGDIRPFSENPHEIADHDVLLAGFPCQPFSLAGVSKKNSLGRPHGFLCDTQGTLFHDTAKIIAAKRPAAFLLENVKNLGSHDGGNTFKTILNVLRNELGYHVDYKVINAAGWVPQKRERIFIAGFRDKNDFSFENMKVLNPEKGPKLGSILDEEVDEKYTLSDKLWNYLQNYKKKHEAKGNGFGFGLVGPDDVARTLSARYHKDGSEILIKQEGKNPRRLTPHECARLMGFEKKGGKPFIIPVSDTQAYRQFGNSVVVPVVEAVAKHMQPYLQRDLGAGLKAAE
jgi:DNA (cytosine-5)-methyltransferase 1